MVLSAFTGFAQTVNDVFDKNVPVTWFGLDFTGAKFLGDREKMGSTSDVKFLIKSWNDLIEREKPNFDIQKAFSKTKVDYKIEVARNHNEELEITDILTNDQSEYLHLKPEDIETIVKSYDFTGSSGLGLMFNVESFNKLKEEAAVWVTFINIDTKEVILTDRMVEPPKGAGLRNYWAGSIKLMLEIIKKKQMDAWKKKLVH
jgi:hypothetical protein